MLRALLTARSIKISAANWLEAHLVIEGAKSNETVRNRFQDLLSELDLQIVSVDSRLAQIARAANLKYGRGHHTAALNFGDCFAYALAKSHNEPLLFKGNDFSQTDLVPALA